MDILLHLFDPVDLLALEGYLHLFNPADLHHRIGRIGESQQTMLKDRIPRSVFVSHYYRPHINDIITNRIRPILKLCVIIQEGQP